MNIQRETNQVTGESKIQGAVFDLDGVITDTASVHLIAWKELFDEYFRGRKNKDETTAQQDLRELETIEYTRWIDGKPRADGIRSMLEARGILKYSRPIFTEEWEEEIELLGEKKNTIYWAKLAQSGVKTIDGSIEALHAMFNLGIPLGVASSSRNCEAILSRIGIFEIFSAVIDGASTSMLGRPGKPNPDLFLVCAEKLEIPPANLVVFEDSISGIKAGVAAGFGKVIGVASRINPEELIEAGASGVIQSFKDKTPESLLGWS